MTSLWFEIFLGVENVKLEFSAHTGTDFQGTVYSRSRSGLSIKVRVETLSSDVLWSIIRWNACRCYNHYICYSWYCRSVSIMSREFGIYLYFRLYFRLRLSGAHNSWLMSHKVTSNSGRCRLHLFIEKSVFEIESIRLWKSVYNH